MPPEHTWFSILFGNFYANLQNSVRLWSGETLLQGSPVEIQHVVAAGFLFLLIVVLAIAVRAQIRRRARPEIPDARLSLRNVFELVAEGMLSLMGDSMTKDQARRFLPLIGSLFVFILFSNLLGLIPGFLPPTDKWDTTLALATVVFVATHYYGVREHGFGYLKQFLGPIFKWYAIPLMLLMLPIELISHVARLLSLSLRLLGNIFGDHAAVTIFVGLVPFFVPVPIMLLGVMVAVVQALVFCLLSIVYFSIAVSHEH